MAKRDGEVDAFVQSFVDSELASLDKSGGAVDSIKLSGNYLETPAETSAASLQGPSRSTSGQGPNFSSNVGSPTTPKRNRSRGTTTSPGRVSPPIGLDSQALEQSSTVSSTAGSSPKRGSGSGSGSIGSKFKTFGRRIASSGSKK